MLTLRNRTEAYDHCTWGIADNATCLTSFAPIPALRSPKKNTALVFLTSITQYCGPVTDPWFDAKACDHDWYGSDWPTCRPAYPTTTLACAEEKEICVGEPGDHERCTKIRGDGYPFSDEDTAAGLPNITEILKLTSRQAAIATRIQDATSKSGFASIIFDLGGSNMLASGTSATSVCSPVLPSDQWTKEVSN